MERGLARPKRVCSILLGIMQKAHTYKPKKLAKVLLTNTVCQESMQGLRGKLKFDFRERNIVFGCKS